MNPHSVDSRRKASIRGRFAVPQDCGQSLIETALVLPLLLLMAFNAINFGYFFFAAINLAAAPRNAVVYSVQGFATPGQLVLPKAGPACAGGTSTDKSVSTLTYNDITGVLPTSSGTPCPNVARVQVCSESVGLRGSGSSLKTSCVQYGPGSQSWTPDSDPEAPGFVLNRVDIVYTVQPLIPASIFGLSLLPSLNFHRQVSMREMN